MKTTNIARELEAIAQTGLHFTRDPYDRERYQRLRVIAAEMLAAESNLATEEILQWSISEFGYATPKVDVRAYILSSEKVLLIREDADDRRWTLPGGWADVNESPSASVVREVLEESGYIVDPIKLLCSPRPRETRPPSTLPIPYLQIILLLSSRWRRAPENGRIVRVGIFPSIRDPGTIAEPRLSKADRFVLRQSGGWQCRNLV